METKPLNAWEIAMPGVAAENIQCGQRVEICLTTGRVRLATTTTEKESAKTDK